MKEIYFSQLGPARELSAESILVRVLGLTSRLADVDQGLSVKVICVTIQITFSFKKEFA